MPATDPFLAGLVDYAGLFPPASHDLDTALRHYDQHLDGPDAAMLGRFVLPAERLDDLTPYLHGPWSASRPLRLSLLADHDELAHMAAFAAATPAVVEEAVEMRLPAGQTAAAWLDSVLPMLVSVDLRAVELYCELPDGRDQELLTALGRRQADQPLWRLGAKLRCGGVTPDLVPAVERIAAVLAAACEARVPLKFTAGLHHPVRGMDHTADVPMHGFLNVYGAALLAHDRALAAADLEPVIADTDPRSFRLDADGFAWREHHVPADRVAALRRELLGGYGSCSFAEPVADLRTLALLT